MNLWYSSVVDCWLLYWYCGCIFIIFFSHCKKVENLLQKAYVKGQLIHRPIWTMNEKEQNWTADKHAVICRLYYIIKIGITFFLSHSFIHSFLVILTCFLYSVFFCISFYIILYFENDAFCIRASFIAYCVWSLVNNFSQIFSRFGAQHWRRQ